MCISFMLNPNVYKLFVSVIHVFVSLLKSCLKLYHLVTTNVLTNILSTHFCGQPCHNSGEQ